MYLHFVVDRIPGNATPIATANVDVLRGSDDWIGRRIQKDFGPPHGKFVGLVTAVDDWEGHPGKRIFKVVYTDGDDEWMDALTINSLLMTVEQVVSVCINKKCLAECFLFFFFNINFIA